MSAYVLSPRAEADLEEVWDYTASRWGASQAETYHGELIAAVERLAANPALARDCAHIRAEYRRYNAGSHVIFCRVRQDVVEVMRILHKSRDFPRHL